MKTILVSGASGIVGYGILRSLTGLGYRIIGTTIYKSSPADCFADIVEKPPLHCQKPGIRLRIRVLCRDFCPVNMIMALRLMYAFIIRTNDRKKTDCVSNAVMWRRG